jgi:translation initiation factor IF-2
MSKVRVYELAKELNVESKELVEKLKAGGLNIKNYMSTLDEELVKRAKDIVRGVTSEVIEEKRIKPTVIRRRKKVVKVEAEKPEPPLEEEKKEPSAEEKEEQVPEKAEEEAPSAAEVSAKELKLPEKKEKIKKEKAPRKKKVDKEKEEPEEKKAAKEAKPEKPKAKEKAKAKKRSKENQRKNRQR